MKKYEKPEIEITMFDKLDIICKSGTERETESEIESETESNIQEETILDDNGTPLAVFKNTNEELETETMVSETTPETEAETIAPETMPETEPDVPETTPETEAETMAPETMPETEAETMAPETMPEIESDITEPEMNQEMIDPESTAEEQGFVSEVQETIPDMEGLANDDNPLA